MKKFALCLAVLALAAIVVPASHAATVTVTFDGYCDGETITYAGSSTQVLYGTHNLYDCANNEGTGGFLHTLPVADAGFSPVADLSDPLLGLFGEPDSLQFLLSVPRGGVGSWIIFYSDGTGLYVLNEGTYTEQSKNTHGKGTKPSWRK